MTAGNPDNSRNVIKYTGQNYTFTPAYMRSRDPNTNDIRDPKNQGYYPFTALWINKTNQNLWSLVRIANNLATWILLSGGGVGPLLMVTVPNGVTPIVPDGLGNMNFTSAGGTITITGSAATPNNHTINFDLAGGGVALDQIGVDAATAPGTNPVVPTAAGQIDIRGGATFATGTIATPIRTNSLQANRLDLQIQLAGSNPAVSTANNFGVSQFDSNQFLVAAGYVQSIGSTLFTWLDIAINTLGVVNTGYFCTAGLTLTLPAAPVQGNVIAIVCDNAAGNITVTANAGQRIRIATTLSAVAGTAVNTQRGDSLLLVYRTAATTWFAYPGVVGGWNVT